jgi:hypothetical protein
MPVGIQDRISIPQYLPLINQFWLITAAQYIDQLQYSNVNRDIRWCREEYSFVWTPKKGFRQRGQAVRFSRAWGSPQDASPRDRQILQIQIQEPTVSSLKSHTADWMPELNNAGRRFREPIELERDIKLCPVPMHA